MQPELNPSPPFRPTRTWLIVGVALLLLAGVVALVDATLSTTVASYFPDRSIQRIAVKQSYRVFAWYAYAALVAVLLMDARRIALLKGFGATIGLCIAPVYLLKLLVGRARPQVELGAYSWHPLSWGDMYDAFPSGHVGGAMVLALLASLYYPRLRWVLPPLAMIVGLGRVIQLRHFPSDVLFAAGLAVLATYAAYRLFGPATFPPLPAPWKERRGA